MEEKTTVTKSWFKKGVKDGFPIALGYFPVAFAFGVTATKVGFTLWLAELMDALLYTGAGQFALLNLIQGGETIILTYALTIFVINCRYILLSISLSQRLDPEMNVFQRLVFGFFNTDEIFAIATRESGKIKAPYLFGMATLPYISWLLGTLLGWMFTDIMPLSIGSAMGIILYAMFISLVVPPTKTSKPILTVVSISVVISVILECNSFVKERISSGWIVIICTIIASLIGAIFFPVKDEEEE